MIRTDIAELQLDRTQGRRLTGDGAPNWVLNQMEDMNEYSSR
jgi:hypothetical protein